MKAVVQDDTIVLDFSTSEKTLFTGPKAAKIIKTHNPKIKDFKKLFIKGNSKQIFTSSFLYELIYKDNPEVLVSTEDFSPRSIEELERSKRRGDICSKIEEPIVYVVMRRKLNVKYGCYHHDLVAVRDSRLLANEFIEYINNTKNKEYYYQMYIQELTFSQSIEDNLDW